MLWAETVFLMTVLGGECGQQADLTWPGITRLTLRFLRVPCFWYWEFVVVCCGLSVVPVMYGGIAVNNVWRGGKQERQRCPKEALPEWEEAIVQSMNLWLEAAPQYRLLLGNILQILKKVICLPQQLLSWVHAITNVSVPSFMTCPYLACVSLLGRIKLRRLLRFAAS